MQIFLMCVQGSVTPKTLTLSVEPGDTVESVKAQILTKEGIAMCRQILIFSGRQLENSSTLIACHIKAESSMHLVVKGPAVLQAGSNNNNNNNPGKLELFSATLSHEPSTPAPSICLNGQALAGGWVGFRLVTFDSQHAVASDASYSIWTESSATSRANAQRFLSAARAVPVGVACAVAVSDHACGDSGAGAEEIREALQALGASLFLQQYTPGRQLRFAYCGVLRKGAPLQAKEAFSLRHYEGQGYATPSRVALAVTLQDLH